MPCTPPRDPARFFFGHCSLPPSPAVRQKSRSLPHHDGRQAVSASPCADGRVSGEKEGTVAQWQRSAAGGSAVAVQPSNRPPLRHAEVQSAWRLLSCAGCADGDWRRGGGRHSTEPEMAAASTAERADRCVCVSSSVHLAQRVRLLTFAAHVESAAAAAAAAPLFPGVARAHSRCGRRGGRIRRRAKDQRLAGRVQVSHRRADALRVLSERTPARRSMRAAHQSGTTWARIGDSSA